MQLVRGNAVTEIRNAPQWFLTYVGRHLSVPIELGTKKGARFGIQWKHEGQLYGSLVRDRTVAAGLTPHVIALARYYGLPCHLTDLRERPIDNVPWWSVRADWRPYQERVHRKVAQADTGVIVAAPRSGKTLMGARIVDTLALPAVYVAPSVQIVRQTYERLREIFGDDMVSRLDGSSKQDPDKTIVVTTAVTAAMQATEWWDKRDVLLIDEFHHAAADTYHQINLLARNVYYRFGLTGTHFRTGEDRLAMEAVCSNVLEAIELDELVPEYLAPPHVFYAPVRGRVGALDWREAYQLGIVENEERNNAVALFANTMLANGIPTIVLVRRRAHADALADMIHGAVAVKGGENALTSKHVKGFTDGKIECLVGTTVIGEGVDVPRAGALVYASGGSDGVQMMQSYYRPMTAYDGKSKARIYDFLDLQHQTLRRHSEDRIQMAKAQLRNVTVGR